MNTVLYEQQDTVAVIRLNRPEKFNAFNREMALLFQELLDKAAEDEEIRCIYISGNGKAFSAGQDLGEVTGPAPFDFNRILSEHYNPIIQRIRRIRKPVVAAVNGVAAGAGANIALCCDVVVASTQASFIQAFSKIGLIPDSGGTYFLPLLVGFQKASALAMLGDKVSAEEAERIGMIYKVFPTESFESSSLSIASVLSNMPTEGLALTKQALNESVSNNLNQQLQSEDTLQKKAAATTDYQEGINAFMEKRTPVFKGK
ncbi:MAG: enoyl-CoA hydratase/isomerase family protein [Ferruginibacter sp.]|nr:enoyl-CoA hydratase/isomerase family protein [Ferruginibacter sp.]